MINYGKSINSSRTRSIGSDATKTASAKAQHVAMGGNRDHRAQQIAPAIPRKPLKAIHRGSTAGLMNAKNTHLAMNNSGYLNKAHQKARNKPKNKIANYSHHSNDIIQRAPKTMANKSLDVKMMSSTTSISKINKIISKGK